MKGRSEPGLRELSFLFGALYFAQGIGEPTSGLTAQPIQSLLRDLGNGPAEIAGVMALLSVPWTIKPLYGLLTDLVPFLGRRRKSYLLVTLGIACVGLGFAGTRSFGAGDERMLVWLLLAPALGLAFADVVIDALMVETGQPRGWTGRIQAVQWGAIYAAGMLAGVAGGWLSQRDQQVAAFSIAGAVVATAFVFALLRVREPAPPAAAQSEPAPSAESGGEGSRKGLRAALGDRALWGVGGFIFLLGFNPFASTVLYLYATEQLAFSEQLYGNLLALGSASAIVGAVAYGFACRRVPFMRLVQGSLVLAVASAVAYAAVEDRTSAVVVVLFAGFATIVATLAQLDLAARVSPPRVAGTVFAALMSISNLATASATAIGGWLYAELGPRLGEPLAFDLLVGTAALFSAAGFLLLPTLRRHAGPRLEPKGPRGTHVGLAE